MFLALLMVVLLAYLQNRSSQSKPISDKRTFVLAWAALSLLFVQVFLGTEVRTGIDMVSSQLPRDEWIGAVGRVFITHRTFSWVVLVTQLILIAKIRKTQGLNTLSLPLIILILGAFLTGVGMAYLSVPAVLQPLHLTLAAMAIGTEALLMFKLNGSN
jgi:cytochrome c oxidase assembly protein subunit 15